MGGVVAARRRYMSHKARKETQRSFTGKSYKSIVLEG